MGHTHQGGGEGHATARGEERRQLEVLIYEVERDEDRSHMRHGVGGTGLGHKPRGGRRSPLPTTTTARRLGLAPAPSAATTAAAVASSSLAAASTRVVVVVL